MTGKDTRLDVQPKWLRPIDPLVAGSLPIRIDPRLGVGHNTADQLQREAKPLLAAVTVFVTSSYDNVLAAEVTDDSEDGLHILVRAATGDEAASLLRSADAEERDHPESAGRDITWQVARVSEHMTEPAVVLLVGRGASEDRQGHLRTFLYASTGGSRMGILDCTWHSARGGLQRAGRAVAVR
jgi:hypothetical protein